MCSGVICEGVWNILTKCQKSKLCSVILHLINKRTCPFAHNVCQGCPSYGERDAMFHRNWDKNPGSTNKYTKFGQLIIRKILKIIATRCHSVRLNCTKFDSQCLSVCVLDGVWDITSFIVFYLQWKNTVMVVTASRKRQHSSAQDSQCTNCSQLS